jgi:hypothetical protein
VNAAGEDNQGPSRGDILAQVSQGRMSVEEGMALLRNLPDNAG